MLFGDKIAVHRCVFPTVVVVGNCLELLLRLEMTAERRHNDS